MEWKLHCGTSGARFLCGRRQVDSEMDLHQLFGRKEAETGYAFGDSDVLSGHCSVMRANSAKSFWVKAQIPVARLLEGDFSTASKTRNGLYSGNARQRASSSSLRASGCTVNS